MSEFPYRKAHFIGIAGVGMSATALLLRDSGVAVSGSDEAVYPPISEVLAAERLDCRVPYSAANIPADADLIVIGKNARLAPQTNEEVAEAFARAAGQGAARPSILSFAEVLGLLSKDRTPVVMAGSFGKTTSVSLLSHCLLEAGLDPSFMIGAAPLSPPKAWHVGQGDLFLLEGDEYPSSNTDDRSKFLHYAPAHLILTPLAHDHVNVFPTVKSYLAPFHQLMDLTAPDGLVLAALSGELSRRFLEAVKRPVMTFGVDQGEWQAADIRLGVRSRFTLTHQGAAMVEVETGQLGLHNIENMVGVGAFVLTRGLVSAADYARAMGSFAGIRRRLDRKSLRTSVPIYEGFGSSYDKARSAIAAMKLHFPGRRLVAVFEPHTFSWRNRATLHWYDDAFAGCDEVLVYEPASQGAGTHDQVTQDEIVARIRQAGQRATTVTSCAQGVAALESGMTGEEALILLSSGPLGGLIEAIPQFCDQRWPI
jgi:UDP-N-acetylmuramate: L-alanyl-gamma-D-glutamyl-meso-diaminopimelate ligase